MSDDIDKLPTDMEDGALKPQPPAAAPDSTKPAGPATDAVDAMDEAIAEDRKKADGKRKASVKETGEEVPQEQWERFEAADKTPR